MLIFDDNAEPIIIDNLYSPLVSKYLWVLDLSLRDFKLAPITILEQIQCSSITVEVTGFQFVLPAHWFMLVYDQDTTQVDVVEISELAGSQFTALLYGPKMTKPAPAEIKVVDYHGSYQNVGPALNKHQMLCHPVSENAWVTVSSTDVYNKYLKELELSDIIMGD